DLLDDLEAREEVVATAGRAGRDPEAADPEHDGGDAVEAGRGRGGVPAQLRVEVGVRVDEAGRDDAAVGVELVATGVVDCAHDGDDAVVDRDVGAHRGGARAVDDGAAADHEVVGHGVGTSSLHRATWSVLRRKLRGFSLVTSL